HSLLPNHFLSHRAVFPLGKNRPWTDSTDEEQKMALQTWLKGQFPMTPRSWIRRLFARKPRTARKAPARFRPRLEGLEDRTVLSPGAHAGRDQDVDRGAFVPLDGSGSPGAGLPYTWTQVSGPDVTGGAGPLPGARPSFAAPARVATL